MGSAALSRCLTSVEVHDADKADSIAVGVSIALLDERPREGWETVLAFLKRRPDLAPSVLAEYAHSRRGKGEGDDSSQARWLTVRQAGQLVALLLQAFPPEKDPSHHGAQFMSAEDSARLMRDQIVSWLGNQRDFEAVDALRTIERQFASKYSWLRRPRARVERAYRLANWTPIPSASVAQLFAASEKRLIRSGSDAVEGLVAAVDQYSNQLRRASPNTLDDLWNRPKKTTPTPKEEEVASDKLCIAIREYFRGFALTANREVQICRRKLPQLLGGAPGSEVDVFCSVPPVGTVSVDPIVVPIEVKLSHNPEARSGLQDQLVARYMAELGTTLGVFVVVWMGSGQGYKPLWPSIEEVKIDLTQRAAELMASTGGDIRVVVVDASLPMSGKPVRGSRKKAHGKKQKAAKTGPSTKRSKKSSKMSVRKPKAAKKKTSRRRSGNARGNNSK